MQIREAAPISTSSGGRRARSRRWPLGDRSGQVMALFAVASIPLLAILALGIDVGLLFTARDEAQRAAESGALAGAAVFKGCKLLECAALADDAEDQARDFATQNRIRDIPISNEEVHVQVMTDQRKVRVFVDRDGVPTFFAHLLGVPVAPIGAVAAAMVSAGGSAQCLLPFSGPDLWHEFEDDNQIPDAGEEWAYGDEEGDTYEPKQDDGTGTGYGSTYRDGVAGADGNAYYEDIGRTIVIKTSSNGQASEDDSGFGDMASPGNFLLWRMPDPEQNCEEAGQGANFLEQNIQGCNGCPITLGEDYPIETEPGQKWGKVKSGLDSLIAKDPNAEWDQENETIVNSDYGAEDSPRAVAIALGDPDQWNEVNGSDEIRFNNFAKVFIEGYDNSTKAVYARFMGFVDGGGGSINTGNLVEYLRLVE